MNVAVQASAGVPASGLQRLPGSGVGASRGKSVFNFLRNCPTVFAVAKKFHNNAVLLSRLPTIITFPQIALNFPLQLKKKSFKIQSGITDCI